MIKRIVKMTFVPGKENEFLEIFKEVAPLIRSYKGCTSLELLREKKDGHIFFTYSIWNSEDDLNSYRASELFAGTWQKVTEIFNEEAEAWTTIVV